MLENVETREVKMGSHDDVVVVTYADKNYLAHAFVLLESIAETSSLGRVYYLYLVYNGGDQIQLNCMQEHVAGWPLNVHLHIIKAGSSTGALTAKKNYMKGSPYEKIKVFESLPSSLRKAVFLDADIVVTRDVAELFDTELEGYVVGAVREAFCYLKSGREEELRVLGLYNWENYFNSGVMLVNLERWRTCHISERALSWAATNWGRTRLHDQDAYNAVINGDWKMLNPLWNPRSLNNVPSICKNGLVEANEIYTRKRQYLIHYSGKDKPWRVPCFHPRKADYRTLRKRLGADFGAMENGSLRDRWAENIGTMKLLVLARTASLKRKLQGESKRV
jgi:lipopolysaccharide biosynthesis glycosyltransferase